MQDESTPVSAAGDPVMTPLDKSHRLVRGKELWNIADASSGANWTESSGVYTKPETGFATLGLTTLTAGQWYEAKFTISATTGVLNLWRRDATATSNEQAAGDFGTGTHCAIVRAGYSTNGDGHHLWFDGSAFTGTLSDVSFRALPGNHLIAPSGSNRAAYQSGGGRFWLDGDGNDDFYTADTRFGLSADPDLTVIAAINTGDQMSAIERIWHIGGAMAGSISGAVGSDGPSWRHNNGNRKFPAIANNTDAVIAWRRSAGDPYGNGQVFVDGVEQLQTSVTNPGVVPSDTGGKFSMFAQPNAAEWFGGRIYAILVFPFRLTDAELMRATSWMGAKQGRTL